MKENTLNSEPIVYLLQEVPGTKIGRPKYNIIGAQKYGKIKVLLREDTQIVRSPGPITYQLRRLLKNFSKNKNNLFINTDSYKIHFQRLKRSLRAIISTKQKLSN